MCQHHVVGNFKAKNSGRFLLIWEREGKKVLSYQQLPAVFLKCHHGNVFLLQTHLWKD